VGPWAVDGEKGERRRETGEWKVENGKLKTEAGNGILKNQKVKCKVKKQNWVNKETGEQMNG